MEAGWHPNRIKNRSYFVKARKRKGITKPTDSSWFENDGIVNTISQIGPTTGKNGAETIIKYNNQNDFVTGVWNYMGTYIMDHKAFMGHGNYSKEIIEIVYKILDDHSKRLNALPLL